METVGAADEGQDQQNDGFVHNLNKQILIHLPFRYLNHFLFGSHQLASPRPSSQLQILQLQQYYLIILEILHFMLTLLNLGIGFQEGFWILSYKEVIKLQMNPEDCRNHVLNKSGSKYAYKLGSSNRFNSPKLNTHSMYTIDHKTQTKTCGFGFGQRPSISRKSETPSPQNYLLPSTIKNNSKTFGSSRSKTKFQSFLLRALRQANNPAPNSYQIPTSIHSRKFSLRARLPTEIDLAEKNDVPPPDTYNLDTAGCPATGKYSSTKYKNARRIIFFGREDTQPKGPNVGPGSYNIGYQSLDDSQFRRTCKSFGSADRPGPADKSKKFIPGPGMYQTFSQFPTQYQM